MSTEKSTAPLGLDDPIYLLDEFPCHRPDPSCSGQHTDDRRLSLCEEFIARGPPQFHFDLVSLAVHAVGHQPFSGQWGMCSTHGISHRTTQNKPLLHRCMHPLTVATFFFFMVMHQGCKIPQPTAATPHSLDRLLQGCRRRLHLPA